MEPINLVNFVLIFVSQVNLLGLLTFLLRPLTHCYSPALLDLFLSSDASICSTIAFPPMGTSDHIFVSISIDFPSDSKRDASFHHITYNYFCADWDGLCDHLRDVPWEDIFKFGASFFIYIYIYNWDSLHARLNSHYRAWSYKKKKHKKIKGCRKSV